MIPLNTYFARIHAHVCGDGHIYIEEGCRGNRYIIEYTNKCIDLVNSFSNDCLKLIGVKPVIIYSTKKNVYIARVKSRNLYYSLVMYGAGSSKEWRAYSFINSSTKVILNWISAFIDDEGHIDKNKYRIIINSKTTMV